MSDYRRLRITRASYFFTVVTWKRRRWFDDDHQVQRLKASLRYVMAKRPFKLDAMVVLPDHLSRPTGRKVGWDKCSVSGKAVVPDGMRSRRYLPCIRFVQPRQTCACSCSCYKACSGQRALIPGVW